MLIQKIRFDLLIFSYHPQIKPVKKPLQPSVGFRLPFVKIKINLILRLDSGSWSKYLIRGGEEKCYATLPVYALRKRLLSF